MAKKKDKEINDADLLAHAFQDVTPLPGHTISQNSPANFLVTQSKDYATPVRQTSIANRSPDPNLPEIQHGHAPGLDKRSARRLRQGRLEVEARLDLHGLRQAYAHRALNKFLERAYGTGMRCVLVITGKGALSKGEGVLKKMVPRWLNETPNRNFILSFTYATPVDGGTGALYILLKRKRQ